LEIYLAKDLSKIINIISFQKHFLLDKFAVCEILFCLQLNILKKKEEEILIALLFISLRACMDLIVHDS